MSEELRAQVGKLVKEVAISVGLFVAGFLFFGAENISQAFFIACVPYGWGLLNKITPNIFLFMPIIGWLIYFIVKIALAAMIGVFALPFTLIKCIYGVVKAYQNQQLS